jgi:hypothetical protein
MIIKNNNLKILMFILFFFLSIESYSQKPETKNSFTEYLSNIFKRNIHTCDYTIYSKDSFELEEVTFYNKDYTDRIIWKKDKIQEELLRLGTKIPSSATIRSSVYDFDGLDTMQSSH